MGRVEINTRVINKHDTEANWNSHPSFIPDKSEIIVYDKDDNYDYPRIKIGDGVTTVVALPFIDDNTLTRINNLQTEVDNVKASTSDEAINTKVNTAIQDIGALSVDLNNADSGAIPYTNADMLGGILANQYALKSDIIAEGASSVTSINGKIGDVSLTYSDVGAAAANHTHDYVPISRTINNKALSGNISLTYSDVGAAAASHTHDSITSPDCLALTWGGDHLLSSTDRPNPKLHFGTNILYRYNSSNSTYYPIHDDGNLTFSLSGTTLTITKS